MLFVAKNIKTNLYPVKLKNFLLDNQLWYKVAKPSVNEVIECIAACDSWAIVWTDDLQQADIWNQYDIDQFQKYLPDIEFVEVHINVDNN